MGGFCGTDIESMATTETGLTLDTGRDGDTRVSLPLQETIRGAIRKYRCDSDQSGPIYERTHAGCTLIHTRSPTFKSQINKVEITRPRLRLEVLKLAPSPWILGIYGGSIHRHACQWVNVEASHVGFVSRQADRKNLRGHDGAGAKVLTNQIKHGVSWHAEMACLLAGRPNTSHDIKIWSLVDQSSSRIRRFKPAIEPPRNLMACCGRRLLVLVLGN